jgi:hypothetical protein
MLQAIIHSVARDALSQRDLADILQRDRVENFRLAITGMTLYDHGTLVQVIEGPKENVERKLAAHLNDPRHDDVRLLSVAKIDAREFGQWDMAFVRDNPWEPLPEGFIDPASIKEDFSIDCSLATQILSMFQAGLFRDSAGHRAGSVGGCSVTIRSRRTGTDPQRRRYLVDLGRVLALSLPDVPVQVSVDGADIGFNQLRDLGCGEIEMF